MLSSKNVFVRLLGAIGVACSLMFLGATAHAGDVTNARVMGVYCGIYSGANMCSVYFDKNSTATNPCATIKNRMQFKGDTAIGKSLLAVALAAHAQQTLVYAGGTDVCSIWPDTEDLNTIFIQP